MKQYYDPEHGRLVYIEAQANATHWDHHWDGDDFEKLVQVRNNPLVVGNTQMYLPAGAKILEGGCGRGDKVFALKSHGFDAYGVDYAESTVDKINAVVPELKVSLGDVRKLDFEDATFDGYWSLGVIEHFYDGYDDIAKEAHRVLKKGGYLFLTVPTMSHLRKLKAHLKRYPVYRHSEELQAHFYQYALASEGVIQRFRSLGFVLVDHQAIDGVKGLKDEIHFLRPFLQWCYDSNSPIHRVLRKLTNLLVGRFSNHMAFFVFKKT